MILILLATQFGAAQENIVVHEGTESNHFVDYNPGNDYLWKVYKGFSPDIPANPTEFYFVSANDTNDVTVHWLRTGLYYLKLNETDPTGCSNAKALAVSVISNSRTIGFFNVSSSECFMTEGNKFFLSLEVLDNEAKPLESSYFPLELTFTVAGNEYSQSISYDKQAILISDRMFALSTDSDTKVEVVITKVTDNQNDVIKPSNNGTHTRTIFALPEIKFTTSATTVLQGNSENYEAEMSVGNSDDVKYFWSIIPSNGTSTNLSTNNPNNTDILWDGPIGKYSLSVYISDGNRCISDSLHQQIEIIKADELYVSAGLDTTIESCNPYVLQAKVSDTTGLNYLWEPQESLDNPTLLNPLFTPGNTTTFILLATDSKNTVFKDTVTITVSEIVAEAGDDVYMYEGSTAMLNASASIGTELQYNWTTISGTIDSGENTPNPIISGFGTYYLEVTDKFNCISTDSVEAIRLAQAPIANDDYDTTAYVTEVKIPVLDNDYDPENSLDPTKLKITLPPFNGTAYVDNNDYTINYRPNENFSGSDNFEYQICNAYDKCDEANVYVLVTEYLFIIPNAFTPNGDNINDYFEILGIENYEGNKMTIYNRWGAKVYEAQNYGIGSTLKFWNGIENTDALGDEEVPTGTYFYILDLGNGEKAISGSVYIDR